MTKARDLGKLVSQGQLLADGIVQASEVSGLASVATTGSYTDLTNKPTIPTVPTLATVATTGSYADLTNKPTIPTVPSLATVATTGSYNDLTNKPTNLGGVTNYNDLTNKPNLATVATTGSYTDLTNKPTIPSANTLVNGSNQVALGIDGNLTLPGNTSILTSEDSIAIVPDINKSTGIQVDAPGTGTNHVVTVQTNSNNWLFKSDGKIAFPDATQQSTAWTGTVNYNNVTNKPAIVSLKGTSVTYPGDDLAADPNGAQTITITGTGFEPTPTVYIGGTIAPSVTFVSSTQITVTTPAKTAGTYDIYIVNPGGATAIMVYGISYSGTPTWTTAAGNLGTKDDTFTVQLQATSNSTITYTLASGSTLPTGVTLSSSGLIAGTAVAEQTFNFTVTATDAELQDTPRSFAITITVGEPYFKYVTLLLKGDGANGAQNNTFIDSSTNNLTITRNGNVSQGTFSPYGNNWSNYFNDFDTATSSHITTSSSSGFSVNDFTIEFFINWETVKDISSIIDFVGYETGFSLRANAAGLFIYLINTMYISPAFNWKNGQWYHIALVRSGTNLYWYVDGTRIGTTTVASTTIPSGQARIGGILAGGVYATAKYISNLRVVNSALYTTPTLTVPIAPLTPINGTVLLTCQSNRFKDNSSANLNITPAGARTAVTRLNPFTSTSYLSNVIGGSAAFDGNADYLTVGNPTVNSQLNLAANDFTIQAWVYPLGTGTYSILSNLVNSAGSGSFWLHVNGTYNGGGTLQFGYNYVSSGQGGLDILLGTGTLPVNSWSFVALTRNGDSIRGYVNGVQVGATNTTIGTRSIYPFNQNVQIGRNIDDNSFAMNGYLSDVQLINGTALYTGSTMPVPTAPTAPVTNTALLAKFTNANIIDHSMMNDVETANAAQISTNVVKYGTGSIKLSDGSYLGFSKNPALYTLPGDFTIEFWLYKNSATQYAPIIETRSSDDTTSGIYLMDYNSTLVLYPHYSVAPSIETGVWIHFAAVRTGDTLTIYKNGTQAGTVACPISTYTYGAGNLWINAFQGNGASGRYLDGYIDDLRITKGYARYTSNFTPPTALPIK